MSEDGNKKGLVFLSFTIDALLPDGSRQRYISGLTLDADKAFSDPEYVRSRVGNATFRGVEEIVSQVEEDSVRERQQREVMVEAVRKRREESPYRARHTGHTSQH